MSNTLGYGVQQPDDTTSDYNTMIFIISQTLARIRTMTIVQVIAVQSNGPISTPPTVTVQPLVNQLDGNGNATPHGNIFNIPVFRLQSGNNAVICDPQVGDIGWMAVADRDISSVKATMKQANPGSARQYDFADGVYMGGLLGSVPPTQIVAFTPTGIQIVDVNGNSIKTSPTGVAVVSSTFTWNGQPVQVS